MRGERARPANQIENMANGNDACGLLKDDGAP
jgi:hypothetical protein